MRPKNSGHVRNLGVLSRDSMAVRKFAQTVMTFFCFFRRTLLFGVTHP